MHELKAVQQILDDVIHIEPRPSRVKVRLGRMKADPRVFRQMFMEFAASLGMYGMELEVESVPVLAKCACGFYGSVPVMEHAHFVRCPDCNKVADVVQGDELEIVE